MSPGCGSVGTLIMTAWDLAMDSMNECGVVSCYQTKYVLK